MDKSLQLTFLGHPVSGQPLIKTVLDFKVIGQRSRSHGFFSVVFCVRDTAATRGQYLALSKAWFWLSLSLLQLIRNDRLLLGLL